MLAGNGAGAGPTMMVLATGAVVALLAYGASGSIIARVRPQLPVSALLQTGTQTRLVDFKLKARSQASAIAIHHPVGQQKLTARGLLLKARVSPTDLVGLESILSSNDKQ
ncbi:unnamed protein product, partial [Ectocarpus fasciculatus]